MQTKGVQRSLYEKREMACFLSITEVESSNCQDSSSQDFRESQLYEYENMSSCTYLFVTANFLHRLAIYVLVTAVIEVPSILILYSYGYPSSPSSDWFWIFLIVENLYIIWLLRHSVIGGPVPNQGPRDMSFDIVWGTLSMFLIIAAIGETVNWLIEEIGKLRRTQKPPSQSDSSKISETP